MTDQKLPDYYMHRDGHGGYVALPFEDGVKLDPERYDAGTDSLQSVPEGSWQLVLCCNAGTHVRMVYGQQLYESLVEANKAASNYRPDVDPDIVWALPKRLVALRQGATDLSDPRHCEVLEDPVGTNYRIPIQG